MILSLGAPQVFLSLLIIYQFTENYHELTKKMYKVTINFYSAYRDNQKSPIGVELSIYSFHTIQLSNLKSSKFDLISISFINYMLIITCRQLNHTNYC